EVGGGGTARPTGGPFAWDKHFECRRGLKGDRRACGAAGAAPRPASADWPQVLRNRSCLMPAFAKIKSREASSCWRRCGRSTSSSFPFHLRTLPATITVSTLVRSISETTAPGTLLSGATLI